MSAVRAAGMALAAALFAAGCGGGGRPAGETPPAATGEAAAPDMAPDAATKPEAAPAGGGAPAPAAPSSPGAAPTATGAPAGAPSGDTGGPAVAPGEPNHREVVLFFQRAADDSLGPERRRILLTSSVADQARQIVGELAVGPETEGLLPTVPRRTAVLGVYLDKAGTVYLDLSDEFVSTHPGGSSGELATIFSIVDSLTYNLPEIRRVRFLVGGEERDTYKNHIDLRAAYLKNMSIVRMEEGG